MDRAMLQRHQKMARARRLRGTTHRASEGNHCRTGIATDVNTAIARRTLAVFEAAQAMHVDDLKTIEQELAAA